MMREQYHSNLSWVYRYHFNNGEGHEAAMYSTLDYAAGAHSITIAMRNAPRILRACNTIRLEKEAAQHE